MPLKPDVQISPSLLRSVHPGIVFVFHHLLVPFGLISSKSPFLRIFLPQSKSLEIISGVSVSPNALAAAPPISLKPTPSS